MSNYEIFKNELNKAIKRMYNAMELYLENILYSPSTINKLLPYYQIGYNPSEPNKHYIIFNYEHIVAEFELKIPKNLEEFYERNGLPKQKK